MLLIAAVGDQAGGDLQSGEQGCGAVKNGAKSLPAKVISTFADGSHLVALRESDSMPTARRKASGDKVALRLEDVTARLVEFTVTLTDEAGRSRTTQFRVLTTHLDHHAYPAQEVAACYAQRWQVELVDKTIKSTLRGSGRRCRGQAPDLAEQEIWGLLTVCNALVDQAITAAVDLDVDPDEISFTAVLHATRDHLAPPCRACGHHTNGTDLTNAIITGPRNRTDRDRTSPRTAKDRGDPTHPKRHLHHRDHANESTQRGMKRLNFRAVVYGAMHRNAPC